MSGERYGNDFRPMIRDGAIWLSRQGCGFWLAVAVVAGITWFVFSQPAMSDADAPAEAAPARVIEMTPAEYQAAWEGNAMAAAERFAGARVVVAGTVKQVNRNLTGAGVLYLDAAPGSIGLALHFRDDGRQLAALQPGQAVSVACDRAEQVLGLAVLLDCGAVKIR